jgi:hypothetical protein
MEWLDLFVVGGEAHFQFKPIVVAESALDR